MTSVIDVGQFIYEKLNWIDAWKLQKLTYYAQAWALAWDGDRIFDDPFQAWPDGPVAPALHRDNKYYRLHATRIMGADSARLTDRQRDIISSVLDFYGSMSKEELVELTHREAPWVEARGDLQPDAYSSRELRTETMRKTYSSQALTVSSVPSAPPIGHTDFCAGVTDDVLAAEMERWADTLSWLAVR